MLAVIEGVSDTNTPSDTLFRAAFADPQTARELTLLLLPERYASRLAGARVTVEPESLVDQQARTHRTDLLLQFDLTGAAAGDARTSRAQARAAGSEEARCADADRIAQPRARGPCGPTSCPGGRAHPRDREERG
ncbi:MAG: hypothetical protein EA382_05020 [Spirochaetaceae bacterium]|nr:MAG: hypothetical protein EA382_05020 [Spirochaetaceae bacterium]